MKKLTVFFALPLLTVITWAQSDVTQSNKTSAVETQEFQQLLQKLAPGPAEPCGSSIDPKLDTKVIESSLFERATNITILELNAAANAKLQPPERATAALKNLEHLSADINATWPDGNRFHFQVLDLKPALVIKLMIRAHQAFVVFGLVGNGPSSPKEMWREVGSDDETGEHDWPPSSIDLYPLKRGPSGNARFLARIFYSGCAGSYGVAYDAREWDPGQFGGLYQVIKQEGSFGLEDAPEGSKPSSKHPFAPIGVFRSEDALITLPFCWFSPIDTWDNPSLCAVDTYDVSGDQVRFISRAVNRPDLLPIAAAIEHAEHRDYTAARGYCASAEVARKLIRDLPPDLFADDLHVTRISAARERVQLGFPNSYRFEVEKRNGRWLIVSFSEER
jgi:hypothetical protein